MASKQQELARWIHEYRRTTKIKEVDHHELAKWLAKKGWPMPIPADPIDLLAKQLSEVARRETRRDRDTGEDYRAYHAFTVSLANGKQLHLWVDIDEANRSQMKKSGINKREQMVGEALRHTIDFEHWSRNHPNEEPLLFPLDFTDDVQWRRNAPPDEDQKAS